MERENVKTQTDIATKKEWIAPELTIHGSLARITAGTFKKLGSSDGYTFQGVDITWLS